jgi:choline dehydrogenase-like flavoprotein
MNYDVVIVGAGSATNNTTIMIGERVADFVAGRA